MNPQQIKQMSKYWLTTAKRDHKTMLSLFELKRYSESLFFGHLVLEKVLKALVVKITKDNSPRLHDLFRLAELAKLEIPNEDKILLKEINQFNLATRYPDYKLEFYKLCNKKFTGKYIIEINRLYKTICQKTK